MEQTTKLEYCLTRQVKDPGYGNDSAGCIDFFVPTFDENFMADLAKKNPHLTESDLEQISAYKKIVLQHGDDICIPSGVHARLEPHTALTAFNKSGVATKMKLVQGAEYVDSDYTGEIHLHVINAGKFERTITEGMKLVQFSYVPVLRGTLGKKNTKEELYAGFESQRGEKWQGSTGTH